MNKSLNHYFAKSKEKPDLFKDNNFFLTFAPAWIVLSFRTTHSSTFVHL